MKIRLSIASGAGRPRTFEHTGPIVRIGRDPECELSLAGDPGSAVSRQHARIELSPAGATLTDTGSSNGTLLNGALLQGTSPLRPGDRIQMGFTGTTLSVLELDLHKTVAAAVRLPAAVPIGIAAALVAAGLIVGAVLALRGGGSGTATELAGGSSPTNPVIPDGDTGKRPPPPPPPPPTGSEEVLEVGPYVVLDRYVSVLVGRQGEGHPWVVLRPETRVRTAQTLVSLPGYRSLIALDSKVDLTLWGNLPEFSAFPPVLESVVMLQAPPSGIDLDCTLDRGRIIVANRKKDPPSPARVRVRFLTEVWELELPERSEVALELWGLPERPSGAGTLPPTCLGLFARGPVKVKTPRETVDLPDKGRLSWLNREPTVLNRTDLPDLPDWWIRPPDRSAPAVQKALRSLLDWSDLLGATQARPSAAPSATAQVVETIKTQVEEVRDPDNQDVAIFFLAAFDEVGPLVTFLKDRQQPNVRGATIFALQSWLSRGSHHADELKRILVGRRESEETANQVVQLLYFLTPDELDQRTTYERLVDQLNNDNLLIRDLAFWQLDQLGKGGRLPLEAKNIAYDPTWDAEKRRPAIEQWKKLLAGGKVPVPRR